MHSLTDNGIRVPAEVIRAFTGQATARVERMGGGLINDSFKITTAGNPPLFLQRINTAIFENPVAVQENYMRIWEFAEYEFTGLKIPAPVFCGEMTTLYTDQQEQYWRGFEYIGDSKTIDKVNSPAQARSLAKTFACFTASYQEFNTGLLQEVLPGFHDLSARYRQFDNALKSEYYERLACSQSLIDELKKRERYCFFFEEIRDSGSFPLRVMHHDAKISNILYSQKTGRLVCIVDYDTVMPGYFFSDLGDMIRSCCSTEPEAGIHVEKIRIRKSIYEGLVSGYLTGLGDELNAAEKKYIHYAGILMIYMQALRFITDYLEGDRYYQVQYAEQNFDRARNQLALLIQLELFLREQQWLSI